MSYDDTGNMCIYITHTHPGGRYCAEMNCGRGGTTERLPADMVAPSSLAMTQQLSSINCSYLLLLPDATSTQAQATCQCKTNVCNLHK